MEETAVSTEDIRLVKNIKWESIDRDNMEFSARVSCYQREAIDRLLRHVETPPHPIKDTTK